MSLTSFVKRSSTRQLLAPLRPRFPRGIPTPLLVPPLGKSYMLVGGAFDYLLRFEIQRIHPLAEVYPWIAEKSLSLVQDRSYISGESNRYFPIQFLSPGPPPLDLRERVEAVITRARAALDIYCKLRRPAKKHILELAGHAVRLAKLDAVYRAWKLAEDFEVADPSIVTELALLLKFAPVRTLTDGTSLRLNPDFGETSRLVRGADMDLLIDDKLLDIKVTIRNSIQPYFLDQLLGYFLLARKERMRNPQYPEVRKIGLYFARHGYLVELDAGEWLDNPGFPEVEQRFFEEAQRLWPDRSTPVSAELTLEKV